MLPVDVIAATAVKGTAGIGINAGMVVGVVARTVEEDVEEGEDDVKMVWGVVAKVEVVVAKVGEVVGMEDLVTVAVVVGMVGKDVGVTEEDEGSTRLNRKPETIAAVDVTVVGAGIDGDTVIADGGADVRTDGVADDDGADGAVVIGAVTVVGKTADDKTGVADTVGTSLPWLVGARPNKSNSRRIRVYIYS